MNAPSTISTCTTMPATIPSSTTASSTLSPEPISITATTATSSSTLNQDEPSPVPVPGIISIATGIARRNVSAKTDQDLMFMSGERVVLYERLESGVCLGACEGVVGRFKEADVDFSPEALTAVASPTSISASTPSLARASSSLGITSAHTPKGLFRTRTTSSASNNGLRIKDRNLENALEDSSPAFSTLSRHTLLSAMAMDANATERPGPRKLLSDENLRAVHVQAGLGIGGGAVAGPDSPLMEHFSVPVIPPRSSSRRSSATANTTCVMPGEEVEDKNGDIKTGAGSPVKAGPIKSKSSKDGLVPATKDSCVLTTTTVITTSAAGVQENEEVDGQGDDEHEHDSYLSAVLEDVRSKTNNLVSMAVGLSMAPNAGLFADRGSKDLDLKVVQMPATTNASSTSFAPSSSAQTKDVRAAVSVASSGMAVVQANAAAAAVAGLVVVVEDGHEAEIKAAKDPLVSSSDMPVMTPAERPTSPSRLERLLPWSLSNQRQRSNSGPAWHSRAILKQDQEKEGRRSGESAGARPVDRHTPRPRRTSEATAITMASQHSARSCPPGTTPSSLDPNSNNNSISTGLHHSPSRHWFGMRRKQSISTAIDPRKPHPLGNGIEGGIAPSSALASSLNSATSSTLGSRRPLSTLVTNEEAENEDDDDDDEDEKKDQQQQASKRREQEQDGASIPATGGTGINKDEDSTKVTAALPATPLLPLQVDDFGFVHDAEDDLTGLEAGTESSNEANQGGARAEAERKRLLRKQAYNRENELKWIHATTRLQADQVKKSSKYKKLARRGVPTSVRGHVWLFLARAEYYRQPGLFEELLKREPLPIHEVIERDVHRCYPDHIHFRDPIPAGTHTASTSSTSTGQQDLRSVLKAYAHYNPGLGYCQGMGRLVGMMLMQMPVEDAFWLLVATIEGYMQDYFTPSLRQLRIDAQVFERLLKEMDPVLSDHLEKNDAIALIYMTPWFMTLFTMSLPWASVLRVWDVFYFDGCKHLFRTGLAILQLSREYLLGGACPSSSEVLGYLLHVPMEKLGPKVLLEAAFRIKLRREVVQRMILETAAGMDQEAAAAAAATAAATAEAVAKKKEAKKKEDEEMDQ